MVVVCLSVRLFHAWPWVDNGRHSKLKIGRKEARGHGWGRKVKVTRPINAATKNQWYLRNRKTYELLTWKTDGVRWSTSPTCAVTSKLKGLGGSSSHYLQGQGYIVTAVLQLQAAQLVTQAIQYIAKVMSVSYSKQHETTWENGNEKTSCNIHLYSP